MAQADLFGNYESNLRNLQGITLIQREINSLLEYAAEKETSIAETKRKILKGDYDGYNLLKKIKSTTESISKALRSVKDQNNDIKRLEEVNTLLGEQLKTNKITKSTYDTINKRQQVQLVTAKLLVDQQKRSIPILGNWIAKGNKLGKASEFLVDNFSKVAGVLGAVVSLIGGVLSAVWGVVKAIGGALWNSIKKVFNVFLEIQSTVGNLAADIGLTSAESRGLLNNMGLLSIEASKFGGNMKDVATIFQEFSSTTGKNRIFSKEEVGALTELGLGTGLGVQGATQLAAAFENIGISLNKTVKLTDKARNMAARYNVNTTAVLKTYNELVTNLTGIGFGKGLENLSKLAAKAQAIRFDLAGSTKAFADAFFDPDMAAQAAAQAQVLGGAFAQSFGDPMQLAFESMNDPAKLAEKFANSLQGIVTKTSTGDFIIPPAERKRLMLLSQALGQDYDKARESAIEQAKVIDKMAALGKQGIFNIKDDDKPALASLMKLNDKNKYEIQMSDGTTKLLENITDKRQLEAILDARKKNDDAAKQRNNLAERLSLIADRFMLGFSTVMTKLFGSTEFDSFLSMVEKVGTELADIITNKLGGENGFLKKISNVFNEITTIFGDKDKGVGQKIFESLSKLFGDFVVPLLSKIFEIISPLLSHGFGALFEVIGNAIPDILGGSKLRNMGIEMQRSSLSKSPILQELYGGKENTEKVQKTLTDDLYSSAKSDFVKGNTLTNAFGNVWEALLGVVDGAVGLGQWVTGNETTMLDQSALRFRYAGNSFMDIFGGNDDQSAAFNNLINEGNTTRSGRAFQKYYNLGAFDDGVIYKDGSYGKFAKGDMVQFIDQAAYERANSGTNTTTSSAKIEHSGTIRIESPDGKMVTWEQMYNARDMVGSSIQSLQQTYNGGFGDYQNTNTMPIKPLV